MSEHEKRYVEIRLAEDPTRSGPGILEGVLMKYGERARDRDERFSKGALHWPEGGVILNEQHNRQAPIMRFTPKVEGDEVRISAALPDTQRGRDAATGIRNGTYRGLSVEFLAQTESWRGSSRTIDKAALAGAALVDDGSYATAVSVRHKAPPARKFYV